MPKLRVKSKHRYANEALILNAHDDLWIERESLTQSQTYGIIHVSPSTAVALARWILKQYDQ